eukprot:1018508-Amphidinium_carterae.1
MASAFRHMLHLQVKLGRYILTLSSRFCPMSSLAFEKNCICLGHKDAAKYAHVLRFFPLLYDAKRYNWEEDG